MLTATRCLRAAISPSRLEPGPWQRRRLFARREKSSRRPITIARSICGTRPRKKQGARADGGRPQGRPATNSRWLHCLAFSPDSKRLVCGEGRPEGWPLKTIRVWEVATGKLIHEFDGHQKAVLGLAYSPSADVFASASADETVCLWNGETGAELRRLRGHKGMVRSVEFQRATANCIATSGDDLTIRLWDVATGLVAA